MLEPELVGFDAVLLKAIRPVNPNLKYLEGELIFKGRGEVWGDILGLLAN